MEYNRTKAGKHSPQLNSKSYEDEELGGNGDLNSKLVLVLVFTVQNVHYTQAICCYMEFLAPSSIKADNIFWNKFERTLFKELKIIFLQIM
jgi:predicted nucleic-acid-binding Zn-ribbon protein